MPVVVYRRFETAYRLHPQGSTLTRLNMGQVSQNKGKGPQHTLRNIPEVPRPPEGFCSTACGNNYSKLQLLRHRTSLLTSAGYRSRHNSHSIHYRHAKRLGAVRVLTFPVTDGNISIMALLPRLFAREPLLTSKNNHVLLAYSTYGVQMLDTQNLKIISQN
jgi:hypothetical protein